MRVLHVSDTCFLWHSRDMTTPRGGIGACLVVPLGATTAVIEQTCTLAVYRPTLRQHRLRGVAQDESQELHRVAFAIILTVANRVQRDALIGDARCECQNTRHACVVLPYARKRGFRAVCAPSLERILRPPSGVGPHAH